MVDPDAPAGLLHLHIAGITVASCMSQEPYYVRLHEQHYLDREWIYSVCFTLITPAVRRSSVAQYVIAARREWYHMIDGPVQRVSC